MMTVSDETRKINLSLRERSASQGRVKRVGSGEPEKIRLVETLTQNKLNFSFLRFWLSALSSPLRSPSPACPLPEGEVTYLRPRLTHVPLHRLA